TGVLLFFISICVYGTSLCVALLGVAIADLLYAVKAASTDILHAFGYLTTLLLLPAYVLAVVGLSFTVTSPTRHGAMGLAIASLVTAVLATIFYVILMFRMFDASAQTGGFLLLFVVFNPLLPVAVENMLRGL